MLGCEEYVAIAAKSFFPSSRMHMADAGALHEGHREAPLLCSLDTRSSHFLGRRPVSSYTEAVS